MDILNYRPYDNINGKIVRVHVSSSSSNSDTMPMFTTYAVY